VKLRPQHGAALGDEGRPRPLEGLEGVAFRVSMVEPLWGWGCGMADRNYAALALPGATRWSCCTAFI
jgi:hypothetical protein